MSGQLAVVGIGPGGPDGWTVRARECLREADRIVGYDTYVDLLPPAIRERTAIHATGMGTERDRTMAAIEAARDGESVVLLASGDPNVYALAGLALELCATCGIDADALSVAVVPGVTAATAAAARLGAPLVGDWAAISLSDRLLDWTAIADRIDALAALDLALAVYNPWSRARREQFQTFVGIVADHRPLDTPVGVVRAAGRAGERSRIVSLGALAGLGGSLIDMQTTVIVGTRDTRVIDGRMVRPRGYRATYDLAAD
ncbi:MAG: precorrin-3B C(17)-methyltransferase [Halococcoides sp.]